MSSRKSFPLRLDPALYAALEKWAADELRSVNGQIEFILKHAVRDRDRKALREESPPESQHENRAGNSDAPT